MGFTFKLLPEALLIKMCATAIERYFIRYKRQGSLLLRVMYHDLTWESYKMRYQCAPPKVLTLILHCHSMNSKALGFYTMAQADHKKRNLRNEVPLFY